MFQDNLDQAATYIDAKKLSGYLKDKDKEELRIHVMQDSSLEIKIVLIQLVKTSSFFQLKRSKSIVTITAKMMN